MFEVAQTYLLGGIALASDLYLPELPTCPNRDARYPRVDVHLGVTPSTLSKSVEVDPDCHVNSTEYLLRVTGIASYFVSHGREIIVQPEEGALALDVRAYLLGIVFCVLCHQRGLLPLHASAVSTPRGVVAFLARSGGGKSSLAAYLAQRGFPVVSDDICLVEPGSAGGKVMVTPAAPWLKLWRASLEQLGQPAEGLEQIFSEDDKYRFPVAGNPQTQPISMLFFLEQSETGNVAVQELSGVRAVAPLVDLVHQSYLLEAMEKREEVFRRCSEVLSQATAYKLTRPWGFGHMEQVLDTIEDLILKTSGRVQGVRTSTKV